MLCLRQSVSRSGLNGILEEDEHAKEKGAERHPTYDAKPLLANHEDVRESEPLSRRLAGRTSAPPPGARTGGPLSMNWGI